MNHDLLVLNPPLVSVCVVTYNQKKYIRNCLESLVEQKCNFKFEIIVGDDASTDGTREIIEEIASRHREVIRPIFHLRNIGAVKNYIAVHESALGKYVAHVDGDDRCFDEKIAKQANFLNENLDCSAVFHKLEMQDGNEIKLNKTWPTNFASGKYSLNDIAFAHPIFGHSSMMYRNGLLHTLFSENIESFIDFQVYISLAAKGEVGVLDDILGAYTVGAGISSSRNMYQEAIQALLYARSLGLSEIDYKRSVSRQYLLFAKKSIVEDDVKLFNQLIKKSFSEKIISPMQILLYFFRRYPKLIKNSAAGLRFFKERV